jgi:hypothetical protein
MDNCDEASASFEKRWSLVRGRFPILHGFCGGLASAFPNTATVEADCSILGWEKNVNRESLSDFSLEGILHSKQWPELKKLEIILDCLTRQ